MSLSEDARLVPAPSVAVREIEGGAVLVDTASGECFELNRVGREIWDGIARRLTLREIYDVLAKRYPAAGDVVKSDLANLANALVSAGLVEVGPK